MTTNRHQRTYQQHQRLPPSYPMNGDIQVFVFAGKTALQMLLPNSSSLSTQPGMTSTFNCLSAFSPRSLWRTLMIPGMNKSLIPPIAYGELLCWTGLWIVMSTVDGSDRRSFWLMKEPNKFEGAPFRLNEYMSRKRFEEILGAMTYTTNNPPAMLDRFWKLGV